MLGGGGSVTNYRTGELPEDTSIFIRISLNVYENHGFLDLETAQNSPPQYACFCAVIDDNFLEILTLAMKTKRKKK